MVFIFIYCLLPLTLSSRTPVALSGFSAVLVLGFHHCFTFFFPFSPDFYQLPFHFLMYTFFQGGFLICLLLIMVPFVLFLSVVLFSVSKLLFKGREFFLETPCCKAVGGKARPVLRASPKLPASRDPWDRGL